MLTITKLPRNDVGAAVAFLVQELDAGRFTSDDGQTLYGLQDNPDALVAAVTEEIKRRRAEKLPLGPFA